MTKSTRILYTRYRNDIPQRQDSTDEVIINHEDIRIKGGVQTIPLSDTANICDVHFFSGEDAAEVLEDAVDYQITDDGIEILGVQDERGLSMMVLARSTPAPDEDGSNNDDDENAAGAVSDDADSTVDD